MKSRIVVIFILLVTGLGLFYWFTIRPGEIRKKCEVFASERVVKEDIRPFTDRPKYTNNYYRQCLVKNGMQAESIYVNVE